MGWRSVMISRPAKLRREHFSLAIEQEQTAFVPFEDIAIIILNHREIQLTHPVLSACADYGIGLYTTGDNHQPNGVFLPFLAHSRTTRLMRKQMDIPRPLAKQAWANIIRCKIENQAAVLRFCAKNGVDRSKVREALLGGFAYSKILENHGQRMLDRNFKPGFKSWMHEKDLNIVMQTAHELGLCLPGSAATAQMFNAMVGSGMGEEDSIAVLKLLERLSGQQ